MTPLGFISCCTWCKKSNGTFRVYILSVVEVEVEVDVGAQVEVEVEEVDVGVEVEM